MNRYFILVLVLVFTLTVGVLLGCAEPTTPTAFPYEKAPGEPVNLINNDRAYDHIWQELVEFLQRDTTDEEIYTDRHRCGHFAEELHNRAEYHGFKAAFVVVEFETGEPHALNAFNTVDLGLVFIDCTGKGRFDSTADLLESSLLTPIDSWDKVAYLVEGQPMGFISLGYEEIDFSYEQYTECKYELDTFLDRLKSYSKQHNIKSPDDLPSFLAKGWEEVRGYAWEESDSVVTSINIYW